VLNIYWLIVTEIKLA